ncbi:uncharacterized protein LOC9304880 isoform X2 [Arabidopsis lyrata subsp. lyrata]|uniref:uncharacterized protein LOC9304880 isoform X2 n=1 Tax=Arabidopsis lyrata subsp. lyrata TaxID=81972 RepID=UPI000A29BF94|nr:uncharacterized protein LOC9304880 isoform X2 [Arabidopsis lyrata subsp. lyrata]|eukprot:XP_020875623.1 uncharacterized protein LOC9304880 isoform X2 [Arabidopsis lyrata subsp. lyrata]
MTNTNVAGTKPTATTVHEYPSRLRVWWMNKDLRYNIAMNSFILILNIAAILYMITHKIAAIENVLASKAYFVGRICHTFGFCNFFNLLYSVSPHLALYFGLPCLLGFVAVMIAPGCPYLWEGLCNKVQELRDKWKYVKRPQSSVVIV